MDRALVINPNNIPEAGLEGIMTGASGVFSNATRGAGIYMYWLMDEVALDLPKEKVDTVAKLKAEWKASRDTVAARDPALPNLRTDFMHMLFVDDIGIALNNALGGAASTFGTVRDLLERGAVLAVTNLRGNQARWGLDGAKFNELLMTTVAHEITHLLYERHDGPFDAVEHTKDPNEDGIVVDDAEDKTCLMYKGVPTRGRTELANVKFFKVVQRELKVKSNQTLVLEPI